MEAPHRQPAVATRLSLAGTRIRAAARPCIGAGRGRVEQTIDQCSSPSAVPVRNRRNTVCRNAADRSPAQDDRGDPPSGQFPSSSRYSGFRAAASRTPVPAPSVYTWVVFIDS
ncbi:hypothetical protein GCM10027068_28380 [Prescottella soli]